MDPYYQNNSMMKVAFLYDSYYATTIPLRYYSSVDM
jgi:hypothetical protein